MVRNRHRLLLLFTALLSITTLAMPGAQYARATSVSNDPDPTDAASTEPAAPLAWNTPYVISNRSGYQSMGAISASPVNGTADVFWGGAQDSAGAMLVSANAGMSGPFSDQTLKNGIVNQIDGGSVVHDSLGRSHYLYWDWPNGESLCDYYAQVDQNNVIVVNQQIPGSCEDGVPRKQLAIAVDSSFNVHVAMSRLNIPGSMMYWQRNNAGTWVVQRETIPNQCSPGDISMIASTNGTIMVAWKDCATSGNGSDLYTAVRNGPGNWTVNNISAACCTSCPNNSNVYLPDLAAAPDGGIRAVWVDGRCPGNDTIKPDIYYREWVPGPGWTGQPIVQVVNNVGTSYYPTMAVDDSGEAHIVWGDDTNSPFAYYRIFYAHGRGTTFTAPDVPFQAWAGNSWQRDPSVDFAYNNLHLSFASVLLHPEKNNFYSRQEVALPPPCAGQRFSDVCPGAYYFQPVINLNDAGIINGYNGAPPCPNSLWVPCFLPNNNATRAQVSKIVVLGAGLPINTAGGPHFTDVAPGSTFYDYIETMYNAGIISGYTSGCETGNPCFRPNNNVTRGQLSKMAVLAFGFNEAVSGQTFEDVPPASTFYTFVQRLAGRAIISGYACGGAGEPCGVGNRPYFRPNNNVTRGQISKIIDACRAE